jgi:triosephosphate isomerase
LFLILLDVDGARRMRILYGGSIKAHNAAALSAMPEVGRLDLAERHE